jgi:hypothetical protein
MNFFEVEQNDGPFPVGVFRFFPRQKILEVTAVMQTGQRMVLGNVFYPVFILFAFRDVQGQPSIAIG